MAGIEMKTRAVARCLSDPAREFATWCHVRVIKHTVSSVEWELLGGSIMEKSSEKAGCRRRLPR